MAEADETIITRFVIEADDALEKGREFQAQVAELKARLRELSAQMRGDIPAAAQGMKRAFAETSDALDPKKASDFKSAMGQALKEVTAESKSTGSSFLNLGTVISTAFGFGIGQIAVKAVRSLINVLKEAIVQAVEFSRVMFNMEVATRGLERAGLDTTLSEWLGYIQEIKKQFPIFSEKDIASAIGLAELTQREFGFTAKQIQEVTKNGAILAELFGGTLYERVAQLDLFLNTGYSRTLQRLGVSIDKSRLDAEAQALGFGKSFDALNDNQKAMIRLITVTEALSKIQEDAGKVTEKSSGKWEQLKSSIVDFSVKLGQSFDPAIKAVLDLLNGIVSFIKDRVLPIFQRLQSISIAAFVGAGTAARTFVGILTGEVKIGIKDIIPLIQSISAEAQKAGERMSGIQPDITLGDIPKEERDMARLQQLTEEGQGNVVDAFDQARQEIEKIEEDKRSRLIELNQSLIDDLEKIARDGARKRADLARSYANKINDINLSAARSRAAAQRDLARDLEKIDRDVANRKQEIEQRRRDDEITAEQRFQNRLKKLQEEFLFDLEDAVRARDAKQIRRLQRRYNLDKTQLLRDNKLDKEERDRRFQQELADLEVQRAQKRQERLIDFQQQLQDIEIQRQQRLQEAAIEYQQQLADLKRNLEEQRRERLIQYQQQLRDLSRSINDRLRTIAKGWVEEFKLTAKGAQAVYELLYKYFGPNGAIEGLLKYYYASLAQAQSKGLDVGNAPSTQTNVPSGFAEGGSFVATRPTTKQFGEKGAELVTAIPLGRIGKNVNTLFGATPFGGGVGGRNGKLAIALMLSPDLEARIVEKSLGEFSDVLVSVERMR